MLSKAKWRVNGPVLFLLFAIIGQITLITIFQYRSFMLSPSFHSDAAAYLLFAEHLLENREFPLSATWYYSTEAWILTAHLIVTPLLAIFRNYNTTLTAASLVYMLLASGSVYFCLSGMKQKRTTVLLGVFLVLIPYGAGIRNSVVSQYYQTGFYIMYMAASFFFLGLWFRFQSSSGKRRVINIALLLGTSLLLGLCGTRYFIILFAPFVLSVVTDLLIMEKETRLSKNQLDKLFKQKETQDIVVLFCVLVFAMIGYLVYSKSISPIYGGQSYENLQIGTEDFVRSLQALVTSILQMMGFSYSNGILLTALGVADYAMLIATGFVLVCGVLLLKNIKKLPKAVRLYVLCAWFALGLFCLITLTTVSPDISATGRYLKLSCYAFLPMPAVYSNYVERRPLRQSALFVSIALFTVSANLLLFATAYPQTSRFVQAYGEQEYTNQYAVVRPDHRSGALAFLVGNGYEFGYTSFWNSAVSTVLADGDVRFCNIVNDERLHYRSWLEPKIYRNYEENPPQFLMLTADEYATRRRNDWVTPGALIYKDDYFYILDLADVEWADWVRGNYDAILQEH